MTNRELCKGQRVQFLLAGKLVQGIVIGDKRKKVVIMREHGAGDWKPVFIPIGLLDDVVFHRASQLFMPIYNPIMEGILREARNGETGDW